MRLETHVVHAIVGLIFGALFVFITEPLQPWLLVLTVVFIGAMIPHLDPGWNIKLKLSAGSFIVNAFFIPFILTLILPKDIYISAFFIGYSSHLIADMDKPRKHFQYIKDRAVVALLWGVSIFLMSQVLGVSIEKVFNFFGVGVPDVFG